MRHPILSAVLLSFALIAAPAPAGAQLGKLKNKVKQKVEDKADKKTDSEIDKALNGSPREESAPEVEGAPPAASPPAASTPSESATPSAPIAAAAEGAAPAEDMSLYTKYDFIPGDRVIFFDDLSREEVGEFPSRWNLESGVFEIARQSGRSFILCTDEGRIRPKIPAGPLPAAYTVEMEFVTNGTPARGHWFYIEWLDPGNEKIGELTVQNGEDTRLTIGDENLATKKLARPLPAGIHTMRIMATKSTVKCYIDQERVANVPATEGFAPAGLGVHMDLWEEPDNPMLIGAFRYAEGGKTLRQQLDEAGRIVTHGILFDSGSARIKAESYKTLSDIGQLLADDAALRLSIEGHTDSDGTDDSNLALSRNRSDAVRVYLIETYKIGGDRLEVKGLGETKPIDTNDTPEGKANNRRVELVKI